MIEAILGIMTSSGFGVVTGLLGSWLSKRESRKVLELQNQHEATMARFRLEEIETEAKVQVQVLEAEAQVAAEVAAGEAFKEAQKHGHRPVGIVWVDAIRSLMRPVITLYLLVVVTALAYNLSEITGGIEGLDNADELFAHIVNQAVFLCVTAVTFWFGSRPGRATSG